MPANDAKQKDLEEHIRNVFEFCDAKSKGKLTYAQTRKALTNFSGKPFSKETVELLCAMFDVEFKRSLKFDAFYQLYRYVQSWVQVCG